MIIIYMFTNIQILLGTHKEGFYFIFLTSLLEYNCFTMVCQFLIYSKVNQLYIYIYPHISSLFHLPPAIPIPHLQVHTKTELISLCYAAASHQLFYIWQCISVHATLSLHPSLPFPTQVSSSPFSMSASLFLSYPQVLQNHFFFFRFHIYVLAYGICSSLSHLLHFV